MVRRWWHRILIGLGTVALTLNPPLRSAAQTSGQGGGYNPGTSTVSFAETSLTMSESNGSLSYPKTALVDIVSNLTTETLRLTVTPTVGSPTTGSWTGVTSTVTLYSPSDATVISTAASGSNPNTVSSNALSTYVNGGTSLNWTTNEGGAGRAKVAVTVSRASGRLVAGTYQLTATLVSVAP